MDEQKRKIILLAGGAIALVILGIILYFFVFGGEEESPPPPPPPVTEQVPEEPIEPVEPEPVERLTEFRVNERTTLGIIAGREDVYADGNEWWTLWAANRDAPRYVFRDSTGTWVALVAPGPTLTIPDAPQPLSERLRNELTKDLGTFAVQFGSYEKEENARELLEFLRAAEPDHDFYLGDMILDHVRYYQVRGGLFSDWNQAERFGRRVFEQYDRVKDYYTLEPLSDEIAKQQREMLSRYRR